MKIQLHIPAFWLGIITFCCAIFSQSVLQAQTCPGLGNVTLNVVSAATPTLSAPAQLCPGANGNISVAQTFASYSWNTGESGQSITANGPGLYIVTVTNGAGCSSTAQTNIGTSPVPNPNITQNTYMCNGTIILNAGPGFTSYNWSSGGSSQTSSYTTSGNYVVTVTNAQGCTNTDDFTVTIPTPPVVSIDGDLTTCTGQNTQLTATAGFVGYNWSAGGNGQSINVSTGGTFTVTVTDNFGCTDTESATVVAGISPVPTVAGTQICPDASTTLSVSNGPFQGYNWSSGSTTNSTTATVGFYTVTVTAANGCTGTTSANVNVFPVPNPNITQSTYTCNGQIILNAGGGFTSYNWSSGGSNATNTVNTSGLYTVTVTNVQGCSATDTYSADIPPPPVVTISGSNTLCSGTSLELSASAGLVSYNWNTGQSGLEITVNSGGTYTVTATDGFGCTDTDNFSINQLPSPQPVVTGTASVCEGLSVNFNTSNTFPGYNWSTGETTPAISVNTSGTYTVTVTAANGCTGTDTQTLNVIAAPVPTIVEATYACDNQVSINAGSGFPSYNWSNGASTPGITVSTSDNYTVTVTNAQGCTGTDIYTVNIPSPPVVDITGGNTLCLGSSGVLSATAGFNQYIWSNNTFDQETTITGGGNYTVTVSDGFGCTATDVFSVNTLPLPTTNISGPSQICSTGSATFSVPGTFTAFNWSTGATTPTITVNTANTYSVTVTAANGCTGTDNQILTISNSLQPQITELPYACNGQITLDAGTGFSNYNWASGETTQTITVNTNDSYTVTVSDAGGCTGTAIAVANLPIAPTVSINGLASICAGTVTPLIATSGLTSYIWSTGEVGDTISAGNAGTYTVTATDAFGCTVAANFLLANTPAPQADIAGPAVICTNSSGTLSVNGSFSQYNWSTGATTATITVTSGDTYSVTVTDASGCTGSDTQIVTEATGLSPTPSALPYACNSTQTLDAGSGFATYNWSGGQNTATISVSVDGTYSVTVTDATGCSGTGTVSVTIPAAPQVSIAGPSGFCENSSSSLVASSGFVSYAWSSGQSSDTISTVLGGTFTVTVTDNLGCSDTESIVVTAFALPQPQIAGPAAICAGSSATLSPGPSFSSYSWDDGTSGSSITTSLSGTYSVTVTDANGCTGTDDAVLSINQNPLTSVTEAPYACDGQITLDAGAGFSTYAWAGPNTFTSNSQQPAVTASGTYTVTVTDINGCTVTAQQNTSVPALNQVTLSGSSAFCPGGSLSLSASSGFASYVWSNGPTTENISASAAGSYTVTATDALGCTSTVSTSVTEFPQPSPAIAGPQSVCPGNSATLSVGGSFSAFAWNTGSGNSSVTVQPPFTATVTVTDANGCTGTASAAVTVSTQLTPNIVALPYACDGQITLDAGAGFPAYNWSNSSATNSIAVTQSGTYTVTVSDGNGCSGTATTQVTVPAITHVSVSGISQICTGGSSEITASAGFTSYNWSSGQSTQTITGNQADTYTVTATDANGCSSTASFELDISPSLTPVIGGNSTICAGSSSVLAVQGSYANYSWSSNAATNSITVSQAGTYTVTVTDDAGCSGTATANLTVNSATAPSIVQQPYQCNAQLTLDGGNGFTTYSWSSGSNSQTANVTQSGTYTLTVTDANGCSSTATATANIPQQTAPQVQYTPVLCPGASSTSGIMNEQNFVQFAWSTGAASSVSTGIQGGQTYTVTVTDANGCTQSAGFTVQLAPTPTPTALSLPYACNGQITLDAGAGFSSYTWSGPGGFSNSNQQAIATIPGTYTVIVTNNLTCTGTAGTQVTIPAAPVVSIAGDTFVCGGEDADLAASGSAGTFLWSNGTQTSALSVSESGNYAVTLTDPNGCTATAVETVVVAPPIATVINRTSCKTQETGTQIVTLSSFNGCDSVITTITTLLQPSLALDVEPVIEATIGETVTLNIGGNFTIDSVVYQSSFTLSCTDCLDPSFTASESGFIKLIAFDPDGCTTSDEIKLLVNKNVQIYVPNIFQPGSTQNGFLSVFSEQEVTSVRNFHVFDRWGNNLYSREELPTNDPNEGWDGSFRGQLMMPGVYVYYFEVLLPDGSVELHRGDITLVQ